MGMAFASVDSAAELVGTVQADALCPEALNGGQSHHRRAGKAVLPALYPGSANYSLGRPQLTGDRQERERDTFRLS